MASSDENDVKPAPLALGMSVLLKRENGAAEHAEPPAPSSASPLLPTKRLLQVSLFLADLLLMGLAIVVVIVARKPIGVAQALACSFAFLLGAWLSCLGLWLGQACDS
jgi:hypothetical protein